MTDEVEIIMVYGLIALLVVLMLAWVGVWAALTLW